MNFHEEKAKEIFDKEEPTKEEIRMAKAVNFGYLYGSNVRTFRVDEDNADESNV